MDLPAGGRGSGLDLLGCGDGSMGEIECVALAKPSASLAAIESASGVSARASVVTTTGGAAVDDCDVGNEAMVLEKPPRCEG
jgi:hypothetical protein